MVENLDPVHYTQMTRSLDVARLYARRLLRLQMSPDDAEIVADHLVDKYPDHSYVIDAYEAERIVELPTIPPTTIGLNIRDLVVCHG